MMVFPCVEKIQKMRLEQGMTRHKLSIESGLSKSTIYRIETGETSRISKLHADEISKVLNCQTSELFTAIKKRTQDTENKMRIFEYQKNDIRTVENEDGFWWSLKDVCNALGIVKYRDTGQTLDKDEKMCIKVDTRGGKQNMSFINEDGLYKVIFGSRKPEAKDFRRWVTHEVLPTIHKTDVHSNQLINTEQITQIAIAVVTTMCTELVKQLVPLL